MSLEALTELPQTPASDLKKLGWRGVMRTVGRVGKVVVTNHSAPEAVILSIAEYDAMAQALQALARRDDVALERLRQRFDQRLAALKAADAGARLRAVLEHADSLAGEVKVGASF